MTVITPEMEKKQEEAMDKFLAKDRSARYKEVRAVCKRYFLNAAEVFCRQSFRATYIPLAKYHARTYKEEPIPTPTPYNFQVVVSDINSWSDEDRRYQKMQKLSFRYPKNDCDHLPGSAGNYAGRFLSEFWVPGFDYLPNSGFFLAPEGWSPPPEWKVQEKPN